MATIGVCVFVRLTSVAALFVFRERVMRRVDKLGRIVIPQELREKYGLTEGAAVEFIDSGFGVTVRASDCFCKICNSPIPDTRTLSLCDGCILEAVRSYEKEKHG